ncbi:MAG: RidA family protein [Burkholderiaceae bacterium]|jgi:reactive intermediate/imine deaminase|nr:RidA family protein [Burkholderiaceae bacterium]
MKMVCPPFKGENKGHYTAGVISRGMLYVSGQLSIDPDTREVCQGDIKDHTRLALDNVDRVLKEAGVSRNDVVMCRVYTPDVNYWGPINEVYAEFFGEHKPARVIVSTTTLHFGCLVEIEAVAEMPEN